MTLDEARLPVAQTQSPTQRAAAEQLLNEAIALPQLPPRERGPLYSATATRSTLSHFGPA